MDDAEIRLECLKQAACSVQNDPEQVLQAAAKYYEFVRGKATSDKDHNNK